MKKLLPFQLFSKSLPSALVALLAIGLSGCLFKDDKIGNPFTGEWKSRESTAFTMRDSLYRIELVEFIEARGYYVPFANPFDYRDSTRKSAPDSLYTKFDLQFRCSRSDCDSILWTLNQYYVFTVDSMKTFLTKNNSLDVFSSQEFRYTQDSIYYKLPSSAFEYGIPYIFYAGGDSLQLWEAPNHLSLGRSKDVLPLP